MATAPYLNGKTLTAQLDVSQLRMTFLSQETLRQDAHKQLAQQITDFLVKQGLVKFEEFDVGKYHVFQANLELA